MAIPVFSYFFTNNRHMSLLGIFVFLLVAFIFSNNKKKINPRRIIGGLIMQFILAIFVLNTKIGTRIFDVFAQGFRALYSYSDAGIKFMFGNLIDETATWGFLFIVKVVPIIIFFGALMSLLYHLRIIQVFVKILAFLTRAILGTSGAETLCTIGNIFLGPTEAPLLVKNYLKNMTDSEMLVVMISGMSTITASMIAVYGSMGVSMLHLLTASVMSVPGVLIISKILMPETKKPETAAGNHLDMRPKTTNILDAVAIGTGDGLRLAANVAAMLIAFISLMAMVDHILLSTVGFSLNDIFATLFSGVAYLIGIVKQDKNVAGILLGQKLVINEVVAYSSLVKATLTERSQTILTYALCGFSNISVIGILIGGVSALAPNQRGFLTKYGWRALLGGTLVNLLNAAIAGLLV